MCTLYTVHTSLQYVRCKACISYFRLGLYVLERKAKRNILVYFYPLEVAEHLSPNERTNESTTERTYKRTTTNHFHVIYVYHFHHLSLDFILSPIWWISIRPMSNDTTQTSDANKSYVAGSECDWEKNRMKIQKKANARLLAHSQTCLTNDLRVHSSNWSSGRM